MWTQAASETILLNPASYATSAAASGNWVDVRGFDGDIVFVQQASSAAGTVLGYIQTSTTSAGASPASVNFNEGAFTSNAASVNIQKRTVNANSIERYVKYAGVLNGTSLIAVSMLGRPQNS